MDCSLSFQWGLALINRTWLCLCSRYQQNLISWKTDEQHNVSKIAFIQYVFIDLNMDAIQATISLLKPYDIHLTQFLLSLQRGSASLPSPFLFPLSVYSWIYLSY